MFPESKYFLPYQIAWIRDTSSLKIMEKSRQIGITFADAYDSVRKVTARIPMHVWVCSKDEETAIHYLEICKEWATILQIAAEDLGERVINSEKDLKARVLRFASGKCIYALSSSVNAVASRSGHVKLDEFALHPHQRLLYRHAEPATTWGGTLTIISTHRGSNILGVSAPPLRRRRPWSQTSPHRHRRWRKDRRRHLGSPPHRAARQTIRRDQRRSLSHPPASQSSALLH